MFCELAGLLFKSYSLLATHRYSTETVIFYGKENISRVNQDKSYLHTIPIFKTK